MADLLKVGLVVQLGDGPPEVVAGLLLALAVKEDDGQGVKDVVPPLLPEKLREGIGPGEPGPVLLEVGVAVRKARFVGEDAGDSLPEFSAAMGQVFFVGRLDKPADRRGVEVVRWGFIVEPFGFKADFHPENHVIFPFGQDNAPVLLRVGKAFIAGALHPLRRYAVDRLHVGKVFREGPGKLEGQALIPGIIPACLHDGAPRCAGGPAVLIVEPGLHIQLLGHGNGPVNALEPLLPHIGGFQPLAGVHEKAAYPLGVHIANLAFHLVGVHLSVPGPEGGGTIG